MKFFAVYGVNMAFKSIFYRSTRLTYVKGITVFTVNSINAPFFQFIKFCYIGIRVCNPEMSKPEIPGSRAYLDTANPGIAVDWIPGFYWS